MSGKSLRAARPRHQRASKNSGLLDQSSINFNRHMEGLTAVLTRSSISRLSNPLCNASPQNEGGVCQFSPIGAKIGYRSHVPWAIAKRSGWSCPYMYLSWKFVEDRSSTFWDDLSPRGALKRKKVTWAHLIAFQHARSRSGGHYKINTIVSTKGK